MSLDAHAVEMQLRDYYRVPEELVVRCGDALRQSILLKRQCERLEQRIAALEKHVPPEIARPAQPELNYHARSKWE
jgi:hypothetical protein